MEDRNFTLKKLMKNDQNSREKSSELKRKTQNSRKNLKLKEKTQNSRKKLKFSAYSYVGHEEKMAKNKPALMVSLCLSSSIINAQGQVESP